MKKNKTELKKIKKSLNEIEDNLIGDDKISNEIKEGVSNVAEKGHDLIDKAEKGVNELTDKLVEKKESCCSGHDNNRSTLKYIGAGFLALIAILSFKKMRRKDK